MGKILSVDYGQARCGIAETDDMKIIASGLLTVKNAELMSFLENYISENSVEAIVVGQPVDLRGNMNEVETDILKFITKFQLKYPDIKIHRFDERFTSKMASFFISQSGKSKKKREEKGLIDKVSATIILQDFLEQNNR